MPEYLYRGLLTSLAFYTRIPLPRFSPVDLMAGAWSFGPVGALVAGITALTGWIVVGYLPHFPIPAGAALMLSVDLSVRGALHEDGLADTFDAVGALMSKGGDPRKAMEDPGVGAFGVTALVTAAVWRFAIYSYALSDIAVGAAIIVLAGATSRLQPIAFGLTHKDRKSYGLAHRAGIPSTAQTVFAAALPTVAIFLALPLFKAIFYFLIIEAVGAAVFFWFKRRFKSIGGDVMGAAIVIAELAVAASLILFESVLSSIP